MVTFAQAQERGERWANAEVPAYQHREVRVREFDLGFVVWAEDRAEGPTSDGGQVRLVIARDSGETTLWPGLPVGEVIRRYEEEYGVVDESVPVADTPPKRLDLEATSFLLSPPQWLQDAADAIGIPDRRSGAGSSPAPAPAPVPVPPPPAPVAAAPEVASATDEPVAAAAVDEPAGEPAWADANVAEAAEDRSVGLPATVLAPALSGTDEDDTPPAGSRPDAKTALMATGSALPPTAIAPAIEDPNAGASGVSQGAAGVHGQSQAPGAPVPPGPPGAPGMPGAPGAPGAPGGPAAGAGRPGAGGPVPPGPPGVPGASGASGPSGPSGQPGAGGPGQVGEPGASGVGRPGAGPVPPGPPGAPGQPAAPVHHAATMLASPGTPGMPGAPAAPGQPHLPGAPGAPAGRPGAGGPVPPGPPGAPGQPAAGGPVPPGPPGAPGQPAAPVHHAATMLAGPGTPGMPGAPGAPGQPPAAPGQGPGGVHHAATMLAGPGTPGMPGAPGQPHLPGAPGPAPVPQAPAYGYPQAPSGLPTVGPGYMAVLRYRAPDGSEQQLIRRSAPGTPHPEWQILHELRAMNVPPQQVLELHTELESCDLPGGYCARMVRETWPQVRISHTAAYGRDHVTRQQGVRHLVEHQGELHQVADGPARPAPNRVPLPHPSQVQVAPPVGPDVIGRELAESFGPQGVFRFEQRAVSRQGVPDVVAQTLVWAGVPVDFGPFFWGQAQPGRPVPTLGELAAERGVRAAPDAGSYLVMGSDYGRQLCVQYGTAHIVAVPLEAGPDGGPVPPQFVNTSLPQFVRSLALLGKMWRWRYGLTPEQAGRWTVDFQQQLAALDPAATASAENWWAVLVEQMWDGLF
ncbi:SUKH-4 family immunity protein [Streptomyces sp. NPDC046215]|uniref:Nucleic acid/nucleotide deaminase of polymorphic system toxin n=1 Tax=Streptomyces stramineus TaxID=173861 RepID=A0ABN0ZJN8_9ACTN